MTFCTLSIYFGLFSRERHLIQHPVCLRSLTSAYSLQISIDSTNSTTSSMLQRKTASAETAAEAEAGDEEDSVRGRLDGGGGGDDPERSSGDDSAGRAFNLFLVFLILIQ